MQSDSGSTAHFFCSVSAFVPDTLIDIYHKTIELADKTTVTAMQQGNVKIPFRGRNIRFSELLLVPNLGYDLVSVCR